MKYAITIEHQPSAGRWSYFAFVTNNKLATLCSGETPEAAEKELIEKLKMVAAKEPDITKEIEL